MFFSPIEVPVGSEPGALEWWQDPNDLDSELEQRMDRCTHAHDQRSSPQPESCEGREECDNTGGTPPPPPPPSLGRRQRDFQECSHQRHDRSEPHLVPDELNSPTEVRRRAIAQSIVQNLRLWNSDSDSFSELSSEDDDDDNEKKSNRSSDSWVTEEEEVIVGMRGSELQEQEAVVVVEMQEEDVEGDNNNNYRDLPTTTSTTMGDIIVHVQSESGVESAESWFTSSDNSHSQPACSHEEDKQTIVISPPSSQENDSGLCSNSNETNTVLEGQQHKVERSSVCSSISTDDSLAWETACEDLPASSV